MALYSLYKSQRKAYIGGTMIREPIFTRAETPNGTRILILLGGGVIVEFPTEVLIFETDDEYQEWVEEQNAAARPTIQ